MMIRVLLFSLFVWVCCLGNDSFAASGYWNNYNYRQHQANTEKSSASQDKVDPYSAGEKGWNAVSGYQDEYNDGSYDGDNDYYGDEGAGNDSESDW